MGVTPYAGVWIETTIGISYTYNGQVTPYAGVWIETSNYPDRRKQTYKSLPTRECGLKLMGDG